MLPPEARTGSRTCIGALFAGGVSLLGPEQTRSGFVKEPQTRVVVTSLGIRGDTQADRRFHGGPDKALHHYPGEHYAVLAAEFPAAGAFLGPGGLGENLSTTGWTEADVAIGDVFAAGQVRVQVTAPRSPCWKIDARLDHTGVARWIAERGIVGWYYRVLAGGELAAGLAWDRVDRSPDPVPLAAFWSLVRQHRPDPASLERLAAMPGLADEWRLRLADRARWRDGGAL